MLHSTVKIFYTIYYVQYFMEFHASMYVFKHVQVYNY